MTRTPVNVGQGAPGVGSRLGEGFLHRRSVGMAFEELVDLGVVDSGHRSGRNCGEQGGVHAGRRQRLVLPFLGQVIRAWRQQDGSGHPDCERIGDSRPSNQRTWENGTPTLMAKSPPGSTRAVHQKDP